MLTSYSHTPQATDLHHWVNACRPDAVPVAPPSSKRPWSLRDRLDERPRADMITAYRAGTAAAALATTHGVSLRSVKRLLAAAGVHRKQLPADSSDEGQDARSTAAPNGW